MADKITNDITLLFKTKLDEKSKQEVGKNLKSLLENAAIGFDEAETKRNLEPIIRMMKRLFDKAEMSFDADQLFAMPSRQALQKMAEMEVDQLQMAFDKALAKSGGLKIDFGDMDLSAMIEPLEKLTQELSEIGERVASTTKKSVQDIEQSLKSLDKIHDKAVKKAASVASVEGTLAETNNNKTITPAKAITTLEHARDAYSKSVREDNPWVVQYRYLLEFVSKYERLSEKAQMKVAESAPELKQLYETLAPKSGDVKVSLEHFVDISKGNELSEYKNQPWARESTLKKVEQTLRNGISVKGSVGDYDNGEHPGQPSVSTSIEEYNGKQLNTKIPLTESSGKNLEQNAKIKISTEQAALELVRRRRTEAEAIAEAERKAAEEAKKAATKKVFRVIYEPEEPDDRSREEILESYGAEYWTDSKGVAETYADMGDNPVILEGEVVSNKPFIIDAGGHKWSSFELMRSVEENPEDPSNPIMTDLREKFPDLFKRIDAGEFRGDYGEIQAELNKAIKALGAGYDAIITRNVIDAADADSFRETSTTYAVLDDSILHVKAAIIGTEDEDGFYDFDGKAKKENIPEYYKMPSVPSEPVDVFASIPKIEYSADEIQKMIEGLAVLEQKLQHLGKGAAIDQSQLSEELSRYQRLIQEISSFTVVDTEDDRQRLIALKEEALRLATALQSFQLNDNDIAGQASAYGITKDASKALMDTEETAKKLRNELEAIFRFQFDEIYDALPDDEQKKLQDYGSEWNEVSRNIVAGLQSETAAHRQNIDAIEEETEKQDQLNTEKTENKASDTGNAAPVVASVAPATAEPSKETVPHDSMQTEELRALLNSITYNVKVVQDVEPTEDNKVSIDGSALEGVLNRITYNVKIAHDDADKTANKIAIDEGALEGTLNRVFANILNPEVEQTETEPKNEPWALEKTLLSVKEVLDNIHTNATKTESVEIAPANTEIGNVLATENTLSAIKTAVESINTKVVKGTKTKTSENSGKKKSGVGKKNAESYAGSQYFPEKIKTQTMYLAKFRAQLMTTGKLTDDVDAQIYELLDGLKQVQNGPDLSKWNQQFLQLKTSVGIEDIFEKAEDKVATASYEELIELQKTRNKLELQYEKAQDGSVLKQFYAEQLTQIDGIIVKQEEMLKNEEYELKLAKMREEQARKLGEAEAKAADKNAKKTATNAKKMAQREAMLGKAGNAVGRAENTWMNAVGIEGELPAGFVAEIDDYYQKLDALRKKHQELKNSDMISEEQKKELIEQTMSVNKMTEEIGELVAEYHRLSGDNATVIGTNTLDSGAGLGAYEQQLKQAVATATNGKAQIKNFDAATKTLTYTVKTGKNEFTEYTAAVRRVDGALVSVQGTTKRTETFFEATARKMRELTSYFSGMAVFNQISQELRRGIQYVREIDLALTELKKVTDETEETYDQFLRTAAKTGARLGTTISAVTEATATFAKLGYSMEQATEMAEAAIVYKNVGDNIESTGDAADSIISTMKGFRLEASESMAIVDRFNEVGNRFAITSQGIGEALRLSASALSEGGNSLDESIGLITAANEVVNDPSSVGTALKTLTLRLRGSKTELEEMGEDVTDMATTTSQLQAKLLALTGGQVDIMLDANTFKNSTQILREMAEAWEDMNDIQRASALELMGGKRQANVLSALIQNFDTVEKVIETSANSAGSALKENERYLDSIQGKIDQFNNSMQAMWSNTLDSDIVKGFVALGTEIIKIIDKIGLLNSALLAFGAYKGFSHIFNSFKNAGVTLKSLVQYLNSFTVGFKANTAAQVAANSATMASSVANKLFRTELVETLATQYLTTQSTQALEQAKYALKLAEMGLMNGIATTKDVQAAQAAVEAASIPVDITKIGTTELMGLAFKQLAASVWAATKAVVAFLLTNPVGWVILAIGAIAGGIAIFNHFHKTTEELKEELSDLKSELQDIQSELESVNSELKTTEERMAELLAKDSLTFTEEEELERLKAENDELQRRLDLLELEEKASKEKTSEKFVEVMDSDLGSTNERIWSNELDWWREGTFNNVSDRGNEEVYIDDRLRKYKEYQKEAAELEQKIIDAGGEDTKEGKKLAKQKKKIDKWLGETREYLNGKISEFNENSDGLEYFTGDNLTEEQKASNKWLDYINNLNDKWAIAQGGPDAKTNAIKRIFNKDEYSDASDTIDDLVKQLAKDPTNKTVLNRISEQCKLAEEDLLAVGLSVEEANDYFTKLGSEANYATLDGKIKEVSKAATNFENLLNGKTFAVDGVNIGLADLFDEEGKIIQTKLSQVFNDTSDQTREDITHLLEGSYDQIKNGTVDIERLLSGFALKTTQQVLEIQNKVLGEQNLELFPNLKEEIDGIIDKFNEFSAAVGSVVDAMDTLEQARAEEAYSGSISIETLENLMKYTDDYAQLVEIDETGAIRLAADAEKILIEQRIEKIKTDAAAAVQTAQSNLAQAEYNAKAVNETGPVQKALTSATDALAGAWSYLGSIIGDITDGNFSGIFERASDAYSKVTAGREEKRVQVNVSVEDAQEALDNALNQQKIANALTSDNIKSKYSSEEASGGNKTKEDVEKSALEELMEDFQREMDYWENRIGANQSRYEQLQNEIDLLEAKGQRAGKEYYDEQIMLEGQRKSLLESQKDEAEGYLAKLEEGSEEWWEVANTLNDIESELDDVTASIVDLQDAIGEIDTYKFEEFNSRLDDITSKLGTIRDLIASDGDEDWFDDQGEWTEEGVAVLGTYIQELETYKQGLAEAEDAYANYVKEYAGNEKAYAKIGIHSEQELYDKRQELIEQQYDYAQSISDTEQSVVDMYESSIDAVEEYIETLIDGYNDYIDSVKEALDAERDLYEFKKNVQKQSKDIAELERKIASLSGSTNKSEIAERRKLEAQLYESRESLNDTYYDHAKESQDEALDAETVAYEETMIKFIESLRTGLEVKTANMDEFLMSVTSMVTLNADTVLAKYQETELPLGDAITNPWKAAIAKIGEYDGDALELMNKWTQGGFFDSYKTGVSSDLSSPWTAGSNAAGAFKTSVDTVMEGVVSKIATNVETASGELSKLYQQIQDTEKKAANVKVTTDKENNTDNDNVVDSTPSYVPPKKYYTTATLSIGGKTLTATGSGASKSIAEKNARTNILGVYGNYQKSKGIPEIRYETSWQKIWRDKVKYATKYYAKGTGGTTRDQWAITNEPQFGDELTMYATPEGTLSFMRAGSTVVPADITANLVEWGKLNPDMLNVNGTPNINMINTAVNKPELNITFDSLVKAENITEETLPAVKKLVTQELNRFTKELNYALKGKGAR